ncbi:GTP-binding protein [Pannus brasiliensis CCIBt3594]|uniref:GTP-binding protein n=1 Tax=Pannus brasiliensis CCIBt3594 TaxID=1427578 RepID=A0AAW9QGS9_9CHRO
MTTHPSIGETHYQQARASLQQAFTWYASFRRHWNYPPDPELQAAVKSDLQSLKAALDKLEETVIRVAAFGLVSRGKSAVVNALVGQKILPTGPLHGVTRWPRSIRWTPPTGKVDIEFIDTPGLDEIEGEARANMAREVARSADLILFIVAGDITRTEYRALCELRAAKKPIILVFNKIDLYPDADRREIFHQLQKLGTPGDGQTLDDLLSPEEIVMVAAEPQPIPVRVRYPDGREADEWETPPSRIGELQDKLLAILNREGRSLLALNALVQAKEAEENIARVTIELRDGRAEEIIWQYAKYKALAIAANPIAPLDLLGASAVDLLLIRALARLYGLPITSREAGKLWRTLLVSSAGLLLGEIASVVLLGFGKSAAAAASVWESPTSLTLYGSTALLQGGIAAYGTYAIGKAAKIYLERGCSWGALGPGTVIEKILAEVPPRTILSRLRQELGT